MTTRHKQTAPRLRFKGFDGAWEEKTLGDLMNVTSVKRIHQSDWTNEGVRFLRARDIVAFNKGEKILEPLFISKEKYIKYSDVSGKVKIGDLLVTGVGTIGVPYLIESNEPIYFKDGNIIWFQNENKIDGVFLYYSFLNDSIQDFISETAGTGTVGTYTISTGKKTPISIPTFPEQTFIGNFFRELDHRIAQSRALWEKSRQLKKAMLAKMFPAAGETAPKIRFKGFTGEWESKTLGEMGNTFGGLANKSREDFGHGEARYITYMNVYQNAISSIEQLDSIEIDEKQNEVKKGDVLFTTSSETPEEVGMSSVWTFEKANVYLNSFCFGYRLNEKIDLNYLAYCLRSDCVRSQIILLAQGISRYNISKKGVMEVEILIPTPEEQTAIGNFFRQLDDTIALHALETETLGRLKKALLAAMLV